jgi:S-adenosylmethionine hydrolase
MLITLTTDFGQKDSFAGIMKGVIAGIDPQAQVVDLTHGIPPQDILAGALTLRHAVRYFPRGSIHVTVVDPGVGGARRPLLIESDGNYFIGPDNGVLSLAVENIAPTHMVHLSNPAYQLQPTGATFHGRDIFAPAAAHLSLGVSPTAFGETLDQFVKLAIPQVARQDRRIEGEIVYIDGFGNLFTNVLEHDLTGFPGDRLDIAVRTATIHGLSRNYASAREGELVAVLNSWDMVEIAAYKDNAQQRIGAKIGDKVEIVLAK